MTSSRRGHLSGSQKKIGIVVSRFNRFITQRLLDSAQETLIACGVKPGDVEVVWVPGSLEVPFFLKKLALRNRYHALIALACILRGETHHYECVSHEVTRGVSQVSLETAIPVASGIITAENLEQAIDRAGLKSGNKGEQAALVALEIADLNRQFSGK